MSSPYAGAEMLQREIEDRGKANSASAKKTAAEIVRLHEVILRRDQQIIRLQAGLQAIASMDKHSGASLRQRAASELARKTLREN